MDFSQSLERLRMVVTASDGSVAIRHRDGIPEIELDDDCLEIHTEKTLAPVLTELINSYHQAYNRAQQMILERANEGVPLPDFADTPRGGRIAEYRLELESLSATGCSARGLVRIDQCPPLSTVIAPRAISLTGFEGLTAELNVAYRDFLRNLTYARSKIYAQYFWDGSEYSLGEHNE